MDTKEKSVLPKPPPINTSIKLPVRRGERGKGRSLPVNFLVVNIPLPYNAIVGRPTLNKVKAAISVYQLLMQYETDEGEVGKIHGDQQSARECYVNSFKNGTTSSKEVTPPKKRKRSEAAAPLDCLSIYISENPKCYDRPQPVEEDEEVTLDEELGHQVRVGRTNDQTLREEIIKRY